MSIYTLTVLTKQIVDVLVSVFTNQIMSLISKFTVLKLVFHFNFKSHQICRFGCRFKLSCEIVDKVSGIPLSYPSYFIHLLPTSMSPAAAGHGEAMSPGPAGVTHPAEMLGSPAGFTEAARAALEADV